jgi:hypothetical protein
MRYLLLIIIPFLTVCICLNPAPIGFPASPFTYAETSAEAVQTLVNN